MGTMLGFIHFACLHFRKSKVPSISETFFRATVWVETRFGYCTWKAGKRYVASTMTNKLNQNSLERLETIHANIPWNFLSRRCCNEEDDNNTFRISD
mmetsp:Transcript_6634/g.7632  ORF Transcript_6634/g.7632 Transcript_6634/m.7632 type:complete len:97 (-) Transcript_6634:274-564(-)